jgi:outer membrane lipoprotein-sorting protein
MRIAILLLIAGLMLPAFSTVQAQTADEIVERYLETIGGAEKWQSMQSMRVSGNALQMGMTFPFSMISMRPNLTKVTAEVMGKQFIDAYDGKAAWSLNPFMGGPDPQQKTEEESKEAASQSFENDFINYKEKGYRVALEGTEEIEGAECYKLLLVKADGREEHYFIDAETYVPIMQRVYPQTGQLKGQSIESYFSDYQEVDGVLVSFSMEQRVGGQVIMQMVSEKYEFNPEDVKAEAFAFPKK